MPGSRDNKPPEFVDVAEQCLIAALMYPTGRVRIINPHGLSRQNVAMLLHKIAAGYPLEEGDSDAEADAEPGAGEREEGAGGGGQ